MSVRDKWVRRFTVDETAKHANGFTIYKITSVLFPLESPEAVTVVSVWKRYSDVQRLHKSMRSLHTGLHLRGTFPTLAKSSFFKRFQQDIIEERAKSIKTLLEFVAEHRLLFASTDFVNFLQTGYPEPEPKSSVIAAIRSSLHLPLEETPPLEYQTSDDDSRSPARSARSAQQTPEAARCSLDVSRIPIYEAADVELRRSPAASAGSSESLGSLPADPEPFPASAPRRRPLPDLISFDEPDGRRGAPSLSRAECATRTEDSYVFEAGYLLNVAARCEDAGDYQRAFDYYKSGIEKMLVGVQTDSSAERRALVKQKTTKYLSYAEQIYNRHLCGADLDRTDHTVSAGGGGGGGGLGAEERGAAQWAVPLSMVARPYEELAQYRALAVLGARVVLVLHRADHACYAMKVIEKIPSNLTEPDEQPGARRPVLPTVIPYMVQLHALVETAHLYFLILSYAPGKRLFDYIRGYARSAPPTPAREVNLENVFAEPLSRADDENDNVDADGGRDARLDDVNENVLRPDPTLDSSVDDLVVNSQRLLLDVDRVLGETDAPADRVRDSPDASPARAVRPREADRSNRDDSQGYTRPPSAPRGVLPPSAVCKWGAEILTALESLHNCGVVCRDLNPANILLGEHGQVILTYFAHYPGADMALRAAGRAPPAARPYVAPELWAAASAAPQPPPELERVADFWSFGAIMYELLCGLPLSRWHGAFTSHTLLRLPPGLPVDVVSLLTQLLTFSPAERLGAGGVAEIKQHPYFRHVDWRAVYRAWLVPG